MALNTTIDTLESNVSFQAKKLGFITVKGTITDFQGSVQFDEKELGNSNIDLTISPITINTGNDKRDEHLKSLDFFHVKEFPRISFKSTKILQEKEHFLATGQLTILNSTKEISIPFHHENGFIKGDFSINRSDYKLGDKLPSLIVGNTVKIKINYKIN